MFRNLNDFVNKNLKFISLALMVVVTISAVTSLYRTSTSTNTDNPEQVLIGLNEPLWPDLPLINDVTYNSLNTPETIATVIATKDKEDFLRLTCEDEFKVALPANANEQELRQYQLKRLTCLHYFGALRQDSYWSLQGIDIFAFTRDRMVALLTNNGESLRARTFQTLSFNDISLNSLRKPQTYRDMSAQTLQNIGFICANVQKIIPEADYYSFGYNFDSAASIAIGESCLLAQYFYFHNKPQVVK